MLVCETEAFRGNRRIPDSKSGLIKRDNLAGMPPRCSEGELSAKREPVNCAWLHCHQAEGPVLHQSPATHTGLKYTTTLPEPASCLCLCTNSESERKIQTGNTVMTLYEGWSFCFISFFFFFSWMNKNWHLWMNKNLPIQPNAALTSAVVSFSHTHTHTLGACI